ncbi:extracellular solute-binding protein [Paenibacillus sp. GYB003]|uniref:extracellular solute-binding protein n=1 Tax=Paenibacillus sp. GYB003 TaxID=2994392 RepID=UPI002F969AB6
MRLNRLRPIGLALWIAVTLSSAGCEFAAAPENAPAPNKAPPRGAVPIVGLNCNPSFDRRTPEEKRVHDSIQADTGVDVRIVFAETSQCKTRRNLMLSSGEQLNFAEMPIIDAIQAYNEGMILPLNDLLDRYGSNLKKNVAPAAFERATYNGRILGIPIENGVMALNALQIREDWLRNLNLPMPRTIGQFEETMKAFKERDPDGNGKDDTVPLSTGSGGTLGMLEAVLGSSFMPNGFTWWKDGDGRLMPPELHPSYKGMMAKLIEWNREGYIWPDMLLSTAAKQQELIARNKAGAVAATFSGTILNAGEALRKTVPDYSYVPFIPEGPGINKLPNAPIASSVWVLYSKSSDPAAVMKFFDYQATYEGNMLTWFGIEGETYRRAEGGLVEFIAEDRTDLSKAKYYAKYKTVFINWPGKPLWPVNAWVMEAYNLKRDQVNRLPRFDYADSKVVYDISAWKSAPKLNDLNAFLSEQKVKLFNGELPLDNWDGVMQQWLNMGGRDMIDDRNRQYAAVMR